MNNCAVCGFFRPLYTEPDGTRVCLDDYVERHGGFPLNVPTPEIVLTELPRSGAWVFTRRYPTMDVSRRRPVSRHRRQA
jgi:hypothetical protein